MKLLLVRHGETDWNQAKRVQGQSGLPLNDTGRVQARYLALALAGVPLTAIYSSPLRRAMQTAEIIASPHKLPVITVNGLKELDAGELDGLTYQEIQEKYPNFMDRCGWAADVSTVPMPGGESIPQLQKRAWQATLWMLQQHAEGTVVASSHNFTILTIVAQALGLPLAGFRKLKCDPGSLTVLQIGEGWSSLEMLNDKCHLSSEESRLQ